MVYDRDFISRMRVEVMRVLMCKMDYVFKYVRFGNYFFYLVNIY